MKLSCTLPLAAAIFMCSSAPVQADAFKPSKADQVKLGKRAAAELRAKSRVLPSTDARVQLLRQVGSRLLSTIRPNGDPWEFSFDVIDDKTVNAFALPGGPVFFYTGLISKLKTEDELAGILGHEMTHVFKEHWAYAYADSQKRNLFLNLALIFTHAGSTVGNIASIGNQVLFDLPFSRKHETQADEGGLATMVSAGYNPQGMVDVFTMLRDLQKGGAAPAFLSDHPDDKSRIAHMQQVIASMNRTFPPMRPLQLNGGYQNYNGGYRNNNGGYYYSNGG
jgi:predicted Zn-dependent protease